ncbi:TPA: hypothetical protein DCL37_03450 [Candidatus Acetothermia bacterium]|nr:hypothetical protein [Candidatus Acetothermia bacterium]
MPILVWSGFLVSLLLLMGLARLSLWGAMFAGAAVLGLFSLPLSRMGMALFSVISDPSVLLLGLVVGLIPLIGAAMEERGHMESLVENLRIGRRAFFGVGPALLGLLPMPGGALLSAPLLERSGGAPPPLRAAANVWFRHALLLVYPISSSLIATAKLAGLDVWQVIPYQLPALALTLVLGHIFLLRKVEGGWDYKGGFSPRGLLVPLGIILVAPAMDLALKQLTALPVPELATVAGVGTSLALAGRGIPLRGWGPLIWGAKPWRYALIVLGMFTYLEVFEASGAPGLLAGLNLPPLALGVGVGAALGLATGRIQAPAAIVVPIYLAQHKSLSPWGFAVIYFAVYLGYIMSPVHPCLAVSVEYAGTTLQKVLKSLLFPAAIALALVAVAGIWLL